VVSIVRRPGMTDAQYRAAVKSASDSMRRANRRHRNRYKTGKVYYNPRTKMYGNSPFPGGVEVASPRKGPVSTKDQALKPPKTPTDTQIKQNQHNEKMSRLRGDPSKIPTWAKPLTSGGRKNRPKRPALSREEARKKILNSRNMVSQYRGGSGKKKYNQASYFAGLGVNPNTKQNQGIYKPYANGGGVRKPKYKE
jgi:hypothetical protein